MPMPAQRSRGNRELDRIAKKQQERASQLLAPTPPAASVEFPKAVPTSTYGKSDRSTRLLPVSHIKPNPQQPRKQMDKGALEELANSIKENTLLQPIVVRADESDSGKFILIAGQRRLEAHKMLGRDEIAARIIDGDPLETSIVENLQREDLHPLDFAESLQLLATERGYTQAQLAGVVSKSRRSVGDFLALLPEPIRKEWRTSARGTIYQLLQVLRSPEDEQLPMWEAIRDGKLRTVRDTRRAQKAKRRGRKPDFTWKQELPEYFDRPVSVRVPKSNPSDRELLAVAVAFLAHLEEEFGSIDIGALTEKLRELRQQEEE